jgi:hypothetical protein
MLIHTQGHSRDKAKREQERQELRCDACLWLKTHLCMLIGCVFCVLQCACRHQSSAAELTGAHHGCTVCQGVYGQTDCVSSVARATHLLQGCHRARVLDGGYCPRAYCMIACVNFRVFKELINAYIRTCQCHVSCTHLTSHTGIPR